MLDETLLAAMVMAVVVRAVVAAVTETCNTYIQELTQLVSRLILERSNDYFQKSSMFDRRIAFVVLRE